MKDLPSEIESALENPSQLAVWAGAGISVASNLPAGDELTKALLRAVFEHASIPGTHADQFLEKIESLYLLIHGNSRAVPRLEFVLDRLQKILGHGIYENFFQIFSLSNPNPAHMALTRLNQKGTTIITANFDTLLESAGSNYHHILHYHGTWDNPSTCGATLSLIAWKSPIWREREAQLCRILESNKKVVFIGYSGRDYYDIGPFLKSHHFPADAIWIEWKQNAPITLQKDIPTRCAHLKDFALAFKKFSFYEGDPKLIYEHCFRDIKPPESTPSNTVDWRKMLNTFLKNVPRVQARNLILDLLCRMGLEGEAIKLVYVIDDQIEHSQFSNSENPSQNQELCISVRDYIQYEVLAVEVLYLAGRYRSMFRRIQKTENKIQHFHQPIPLKFRYFKAGAATFGMFFLRWPTLFRKGFKAINSAPRHSLPDLEDELWALHGELHFLLQIANALPKRIFACVHNHFHRVVQIAGVRISRKYLNALRSSKNGHYDEYLLQMLLSASKVYGSSETRMETQKRRWLETDNLKQTLIFQRHIYYQRRPTEEQIVQGVTHAYSLKNHYELLGWLGLAKQYLPHSLSEWITLENETFSRIETGFPEPFTKLVIKLKLGLINRKNFWHSFEQRLP